MPTREELIKQCRYYKGEETSPYNNRDLYWYWDMERIYVRDRGVFQGESDYYTRVGGKSFPGIPSPLLLIMFTSWAKDVYDIQRGLPQFYKIIEDYLFVADDHFPQDQIPS